jgi:TorA maturation chaperone TorD
MKAVRAMSKEEMQAALEQEPLAEGQAAADEALSAEDKAELLAVLEGRTATYGMLARFYRDQIDQEFFDALCGMRYAVKTENDEVNTGNRMIHGYLSNAWERTMEELAVDFTRVFLGAGIDAYSAAYPFESVHTSGRRLLMQDARGEVVAIYRAYGVDKSDSWKVGEDHVSMELEFMMILSERSTEAVRADDMDEATNLLKAQYNFLMEHLISWTPMLFAEMRKFAKTDMYKGLSYLTQGILQTDKELLEDLLEEE